MLTRAAPVAARIESTFCWITAAVVALDRDQSYEKVASSAALHPSVRNRPTMVVQALALEFHPCTKRTGVWVGAGFGFRAKAADSGTASGSVIEPQAASAASAGTAMRTEMRRIGGGLR